MKLVQRSFGYGGNKPFPDARRPPRFEAVCLRGPLVEAANDRDLMSIRRPHTKKSNGYECTRDEHRSLSRPPQWVVWLRQRSPGTGPPTAIPARITTC